MPIEMVLAAVPLLLKRRIFHSVDGRMPVISPSMSA